jgi:hypothetical protein
METNVVALQALGDISRIMRAYLPPASEITAEEAMEEIIAVMDRNSVTRITRKNFERGEHAHQESHH